MNRIWLLIVLVLGVFLYFMYKKQNTPQEAEHVEQMVESTKKAEEDKDHADKAMEEAAKEVKSNMDEAEKHVEEKEKKD